MENNALVLENVRGYLPTHGELADMCAFFAVFSDITRVKIISALAICELNISEIVSIAGVNQTTVSHQLRILRDSGFVTYRREGKAIFYKTANSLIDDILLTGARHLGY